MAETKLKSQASDIFLTGWVESGETWTYVSSDDPTYTVTISGDKTSKYSAGMRVKLTDATNGVVYFIITSVSYSAPNTILTLYGGTDYDLSGGAITNIYYSPMKAPFGFPLDPSKWTEIYKNTTNLSQATPAANTWYNIGSQSLTVPIGLWTLSYSAVMYIDGTATRLFFRATLSTTNNSETDNDFTVHAQIKNASNFNWYLVPAYSEKIVNLTTKTTYYLNAMTEDSGMDYLIFQNSLQPTIIKAVCAYL